MAGSPDAPAPAGPAASASLERYRPLIDDWPAFVRALERPLPVTVWTNPLRSGLPADLLQNLLAGEGHAPEPLGWCPGAFRLADGATPGRGLLGVSGLYHIQEEVSLLPVELLDPRPGERVLDLCAAPGGKTARIAVAMENRGTVVANDVDWRRLVAVGRNLDRLGVVNVATTAWDAANFPEEGGPFDRVLADVPCT
ncbi:MAG: RsmB/NOP family class I SAM-dependent RNA methyltransferase, partial [Acidobacteriota bacterium]